MYVDKDFVASIGKSFHRELMTLFKKEHTPTLASIKKSVSSKEFSTSAALLHKMKGSSKSVGALKLAEKCLELEKKGSNIQSADLSELEEIFTKTLEEK